MTLRVKSLAALCAIAAVIVGGTFVVGANGDVGVKTQRPPGVTLQARNAPKAPAALRQSFQNLQRQHRLDHVTKHMSAAQRRATAKAARELFAKAHPQLAKSAGLRAAKTTDGPASAFSYVYTDWFKTNDDNAWLGLEWWNYGGGTWYGYTVTWDPIYGAQYGNQYLNYQSGSYFGYWYWR